MRTLVVLSCLALVAPVAGAQNDVQAAAVEANEEFQKAYQAKDWKRAVAASQRLAELLPDNSFTWYNLACSQAQLGDSAGALGSLARAIETGFHDDAHIRSDADLESLRESPRFQELVETARVAAEADWKEFLKRAEGAEPLVEEPMGYEEGQPVSVLLALHPYAGSADLIADVWRNAAVAQGLLLVAPEAVNPMGPGFEWGTPRQAEYLVEKTLDQVRQRYVVEEVILTGFSQGGFMVFHLGLSHPDWFSAVIPVGGAFSPDATPIPDGDLPRFRILVGEDDQAAETNRQAEKLLKEAGADVELNVYPEVGHAFPLDTDTELTRVLKGLLKGGS